MLTPGNLAFPANDKRAADSRPYGRFPAVCKKDSGIDWWSNKRKKEEKVEKTPIPGSFDGSRRPNAPSAAV